MVRVIVLVHRPAQRRQVPHLCGRGRSGRSAIGLAISPLDEEALLLRPDLLDHDREIDALLVIDA